MLIIEENAKKIIGLHAQAEYPRECCGIMEGRRLGRDGIVLRAVPAKNQAEKEQQGKRFRMNPLEIAKAELEAEAAGYEIIGFYHSHPDQEAAASKADISHMIEGYSYVIVSVRDGRCAGGRSFQRPIRTDADAEEEKILVKEKEHADFSVCVSNIAGLCEPEGKA